MVPVAGYLAKKALRRWIIPATATGGAAVLLLGGTILGGGATAPPVPQMQAVTSLAVAAAVSNVDTPASPYGAAGGLNVDALPAHARQWAPHIVAAAATCPGLPPGMLAAQLQAESGWNPRAVSRKDAEGLAQFVPGTWAAHGVDGNGDGVADPFNPVDAIYSAAAYDCVLRDMVAGVEGDPDTLMLAAYNAGPGAVLQYGGVPPYTETQGYIAKIERLTRTLTLAAPAGGGTAAPYGGPSGTVPDPTGTGGYVTRAVVHMLNQVRAAFGDGWHSSITCWDAHAWNPTSYHPRGQACDYMIGTPGRFPGPADTAQGWQVARWLVANTGPLHVIEVIWQGQIWTARRASEGWRPYGGGGVYNSGSATGGHYDHIHVSIGR